MLSTILRRLLGVPDTGRGSRQRRRFARGLELIARDARERSLPLHVMPPMIRPSVAEACEAPAAAIAAALRDPLVQIDPWTLGAIRRFLTDGCTSPLFGSDPDAALLELTELEDRVQRLTVPDYPFPGGPHYSPSGRNR
jgi:hypothetical protein